MNKMMKTLAGVALTVAVLFAGRAYAVTFTLDPVGGAVSGLPGQTIGWGFTLTNDTADYLVVSSTEFQPVPAVGSYADFLGPQFLEVAPSATVTQAFELAGQLGVGSFTIDLGAAVGDVATGSILVSYDLFSVSTADTNFDPGIHGVSFGNLVRADASVAPVPEPATMLLLGSGLCAVAGLRRRFK